MYPKFIEVHEKGKAISINIEHLVAFSDRIFHLSNNAESNYRCDESYNDIKQLITDCGCLIHKADPRLDLTHPLTLEDLKAYGIPTEVLGRIATICHLNPLEKEDLVKILAHSDQSPLQEYKKAFSALNITLDMTPKAMETVAELAMQRNLGARGLGTILYNVLSPVMYKIGGNRKHLKLKLDSECFTRGVAPALQPVKRKTRVSGK